MAAYIDIMPTILDLCGVTAPKDVRFDGKSLRHLLEGTVGQPPHEKLFFWLNPPVMKGSYGQLSDPVLMHFERRNYAIRAGSWKLVKGMELYDLKNDSSEAEDLAAVQPEKVKELQTAFDRWANDVIPGGDFVRPPVPVNGENMPSFMSNDFHGGTVISMDWVQIHGDGPRYSYEKLIRDKITGWDPR